MPTETDPRYSLTELADLAGVTARTIRYYISQGLLTVDATPGPGPKYDDTHLARLRLIKRLQAEHLPLADIRHRLEGLADEDVLALAEEPVPAPPDSALDYIRNLTQPVHRASEASPPRYRMALASVAPLQRSAASAPPPAMAASMAPPAPTPAPPASTSIPQRSQWERIELAPDIELHVRRPLRRSTSKQLDRLIAVARDLFARENQP